jgi:hypothetical protein
MGMPAECIDILQLHTLFFIFGQQPLVPFLLLGPPFFPIIIFGPPPR